jgi:hypothetical protein
MGYSGVAASLCAASDRGDDSARTQAPRATAAIAILPIARIPGIERSSNDFCEAITLSSAVGQGAAREAAPDRAFVDRGGTTERREAGSGPEGNTRRMNLVIWSSGYLVIDWSIEVAIPPSK